VLTVTKSEISGAEEMISYVSIIIQPETKPGLIYQPKSFKSDEKRRIELQNYFQ
jgi:hypothetical protein